MYQKISGTYTTRIFYEVENFLNLVKYIVNIFLYIHKFLMNNVITQSLYPLSYSNCYIKSFCDVKKDTMVPRNISAIDCAVISFLNLSRRLKSTSARLHMIKFRNNGKRAELFWNNNK